MATYYYGIDKGKSTYDAQVSTSTTGKVIELEVDDTVLSRSEVLLALDKLKDLILRKPFPPL